MYEVNKGVSFISNGVVYSEGDKISKEDFRLKEIFYQFVDAGKIIKKTEEKPAKGENVVSNFEKKIEGLRKSVEDTQKKLDAKPDDEKLKQKHHAAAENLKVAEAEVLKLQEGVQ